MRTKLIVCALVLCAAPALAFDRAAWREDLAQVRQTLATKYAKDSMRTIETMTLRDGYVYEQGNTAKLSTSRDAAEAVRAFVEKRAPRFRRDPESR